MAVASHPRAAVVFNPTKSGVAQLRAAVAAVEAELGWRPSLWLETQADDPGRAATESALEQGVDLVIAAGGDGTVRYVAGALHGHDIPLGILPQGTGNLLARTLDLPLGDAAAAARVAFGRGEQALDLIEVSVDGARAEPSVVLSGVGVDAAMIDATSDQLKKRVGWLAYIEGLVRALPKIRPFRVRISIDGREPRGHKVSAVMFANLADLPGNVSLAPDAAVDDGLMDVVVVQPRHFFDWLWVWRRFSWENAVLRKTRSGNRFADRFKGRNRSQVVHVRARRAELWIDDDAWPTQVDGDAVGSARHLAVTLHPRAIRVRVPA